MSPTPISFVMTTYNQEQFVGEAVQAALDQRYPHLEVVIYDDCSTDGTWDVIQEVVGRYTGPHAVVIHRQERNVGPMANTLDAVNRAGAQFLVRGHGDDISLPDRVGKVAALRQRTGATMISHNALKSKGLGKSVQLLRQPTRTEQLSLAAICRESWTEQMLGATFCIDRTLFETFGALDKEQVVSGGDHVLPLRAALLDGFWYLEDPLLLWRQHPGQMTKETADYTGSMHVVGETMKAFEVAPQLQRLADVRNIRQRGDRPELGQAEQLVLETIVNTTATWQVHRAKLAATGRVLDWAVRRSWAAPDPAGVAAELRAAELVSRTVSQVLFVNRSPASPDKVRRLRKAVADLVVVAKAWALARNRLHIAGLRPAWSPAAQ